MGTDTRPGETPDAVDDQGRKTGPWTDPDSHGGVMVGSYVDGERHGTWRHYATDGQLRSEGDFDHGELHGAWTWYRVTGGLMQRGGFDRGEKHGLWERWNAKGEPIDSGSFDHGRKTGEWTTFNPDGTVKRVTTHKARPQ